MSVIQSAFYFMDVMITHHIATSLHPNPYMHKETRQQAHVHNAMMREEPYNWESFTEENICKFHEYWFFVNVFLLQFSINFANIQRGTVSKFYLHDPFK